MMGATRIGKGVKLDNLIQIAHNCSVGEHTVMAAQAGVAGSAKNRGSLYGGRSGRFCRTYLDCRRDSDRRSERCQQADRRPGDRVMGSPAVDMGEYARGLVYAKKLGSLYERVKELEKKIK